MRATREDRRAHSRAFRLLAAQRRTCGTHRRSWHMWQSLISAWNSLPPIVRWIIRLPFSVPKCVSRIFLFVVLRIRSVKQVANFALSLFYACLYLIPTLSGIHVPTDETSADRTGHLAWAQSNVVLFLLIPLVAGTLRCVAVTSMRCHRLDSVG